MAEEILAQLHTIDPAILLEVVRADQGSLTFKISDWSVRSLSDQGVGNPTGLWLFSGRGYDEQGVRLWAVVLKMLEREEPEPPPSDLWYWKREYWVAQSGLTARLATHVNAPRFYRAEETEKGAWIWMEFVQDLRPGKWTLDDYAFAARELGRWNGMTFLAGETPDGEWLCRQHCRGWLRIINLERVWQFP